MKRKKTFKSLAELSADSLSAVRAPDEKAKPTKLDGFAEAPPKIPPNTPLRVPEVRGFHRWGINE
jgi:hypothetical protein